MGNVRPTDRGNVKPMTNPTTTTALVLALLACTAVALAAPASAEPTDDPEDDCPAVVVMLYDPYLAVEPECITVPPGFP